MKMVMKHVFERGSQPAKTVEPWMPIWSQVNTAHDELRADIDYHIKKNQHTITQR